MIVLSYMSIYTYHQYHIDRNGVRTHLPNDFPSIVHISNRHKRIDIDNGMVSVEINEFVIFSYT